MTNAVLLRLVGAVIAGLCTAALAGCGVAPDEREADPQENPEQLLAQLAANVKEAKSVTFTLTPEDTVGLARISGTVTEDGSFTGTLAERGGSGDLIVVDRRTFVRGDEALWLADDGSNRAEAHSLAGRWVELPDEVQSGSGLVAAVGQFAPRLLAHCFMRVRGTLSAGPPTVVDGRDVIVLRDRGDRPGTARGEIHVAAHGALLPVAEFFDGHYTPGPVDPRCGDADVPPIAGEVRYLAFDRAVDVVAPKGAIKW